MRRVPIVLALCVAFATPAFAAIVGDDVTYEVDGQRYQGWVARNDAIADPLPLVLVVHDWDGLTDYERQRARMLAELGFAAFAVDLYGEGVRPTTREDKQARSGSLYADRAALRERLARGLAVARQQPGVDPARAVAVGYCFGGASVLEWARAGSDLLGFVSFHGGLRTPEGASWSQVRAPLLILHGTADPAAPMSEVAALAHALDGAGVDYRMELYGGAKHAFTVWDVPDTAATAYDPDADRASWQALLRFLDERLR